ncbi:MAG TPA: ferritin-like domain-containing protein [Actinomycetes bacterium]|nr:ferritin-like domain-containing protein [Actinomycetes bacterium]
MTESPSPARSDSSSPASDGDAALWQEVLATEHAVIWCYGLVGSVSDLADEAERALSAHRARRSACIAVLVELGEEPVASAAAYDVNRPANPDAARRLAAALESDATTAYVGLAAAAERRSRLLAAQWLTESAVAQTQWDGQVPALPGFPD